MELNFINQNKKEDWDNFLIFNQGSFLQSFAWGNFQKSLGKKVWRLEIKENNLILGEAQIIKEKFPWKLGYCFYIPFGPVLKKQVSLIQQKKILSLIFAKMSKIAKEERAIFLKVEPERPLPTLGTISQSFPSQKRIQPAQTLILDLQKPEKEIFDNFIITLRYNIRLAKRKGVKVRFLNAYIPEFSNLIKKTSKIDRFQPFDKLYYKRLFDFSGQKLKIKSSLAEFQGKILSVYILVFFGQRATCLHGASEKSYRSLKGPSLLQWEQIKLARREGYRIYDFWGIDEKKMKGVTFFKKGFRGQVKVYPESRDLIFFPARYKLYKTLRYIRKWFSN